MLGYLTYHKPWPDGDDKEGCVELANYVEPLFIATHGPGTRLGIPIRRNPEKDSNPFAIDLSHSVAGPSDLKFRRDPFYFGERRYSVHPQYLMTFNSEDSQWYAMDHGDPGIYFWTQWEPSDSDDAGLFHGRRQLVRGMVSVHEARLAEVVAEGSRRERHWYRNKTRVFGDGGNKKSSLVIDLRRLPCIDMELDPECWPDTPEDFTGMLRDEIAYGRFSDGDALPFASNEPMASVAESAALILESEGLARRSEVRLLDGRVVGRWTTTVSPYERLMLTSRLAREGFNERQEGIRMMSCRNPWARRRGIG
jgi:hypothetical protein